MGSRLKKILGGVGLITALLGGVSYSQNTNNLFEIYNRGFPARVGVLYVITDENIPLNLLEKSLNTLRDPRLIATVEIRPRIDGPAEAHEVATIKSLENFYSSGIGYYGFDADRELVDIVDLGVAHLDWSAVNDTFSCKRVSGGPRDFEYLVNLQNPGIESQIDSQEIEFLNYVVVRSERNVLGRTIYSFNTEAPGCAVLANNINIAFSNHNIFVPSQVEDVNYSGEDRIAINVDTTVSMTGHEVEHLFGANDHRTLEVTIYNNGCAFPQGFPPLELIGVKL